MVPHLAPLAISRAPVILISIDTLRADHLGCYGYSRPISPFIDRFRRDAVLFEQAIAQAPSTLPSHASMLSSLWPEDHGAFFMRKNALPDAVLTLPEALADHGYRTAGFNGGGQMAPEFGLGQGFELYEVVGAAAKTAETVRRAEVWIDAHGEDPFFLFLHTYEIHHPYTPEPEALGELAPAYRGSLPNQISKDLILEINRGERNLEVGDLDYIIAAYDAEIRSMDAAIGQFFAFLRQRDLYDRSLIILTSDHGEEFGERGKVGWHSHTLFDELLRVPLLVKLPASRRGGGRVAAQVRGIDLPPTVLSLLGLPPQGTFDGFDLRHMIEDERFDPELPALSQQDTGVGVDHSSLRVAGWKLYPNRLYQMQRLGSGGGRLRYLRARLAWGLGQDRLYQMAQDPAERMNLAGREKAARQRLQELRERLKAERQAPSPTDAEPNQETLERLEALGYLD